MITKLVSSICLIFLFTSAFAQQKVYFVKNNGKNVDTKDSADFIRIVSMPDSGSQFYNLKEFYKDGKPKLIGKTSRVDVPILEGQCVTFYPSGKKKEMSSYIKGQMFGNIYDYYPNGKIYTVKHSSKNIDTKEQDITIQTAIDSTGKELVVDGNGYYLGYDDKFAYIEEEGNVKDGVKDGEWKGQDIIKENKITFTEKYQNGKMISGQSVRNGVTTNYTERQVNPMYKGGEVAFGGFLQAHIRYPKEEKEKNIMGRVYIQFVVEKDGKLSDYEVIKSASEGFSAEALRVLKQSPPWVPGYRLGVPVRVQYTVPINFSLQ